MKLDGTLAMPVATLYPQPETAEDGCNGRSRPIGCLRAVLSVLEGARKPCRAHRRTARLLHFLPGKEEAMPVLNTACAERATATPNPQPAPADLAERCLRSNPYLALKNVSCGWLDGVLVLRGCLPSY
jgi:hypothetical protein